MCEEGYIPCGPGDGDGCYENTTRCDGELDCLVSHADELICCDEGYFGCYTLEDGHYRCYHNELRCDDVCRDYTPPDDCKESLQFSLSLSLSPLSLSLSLSLLFQLYQLYHFISCGI